MCGLWVGRVGIHLHGFIDIQYKVIPKLLHVRCWGKKRDKKQQRQQQWEKKGEKMSEKMRERLDNVRSNRKQSHHYSMGH